MEVDEILVPLPPEPPYTLEAVERRRPPLVKELLPLKLKVVDIMVMAAG